jgi:putative N6-adenine-specific DNA methylase
MNESTDLLSLFAVTAPGLEPLVAAELAELGVRGEAEVGGVAWMGDPESLYRANLSLRTASRILVRIAEFKAKTFFELERHARAIPWERYVAKGRAVRVRATCHKSRLYHQRAVEERILAAIAHRAGATAAVDLVPTPAPAPTAPPGDESEGAQEQMFIVRFVHDRAVVSADSSGALLHLRGYRQAVAKAPLRETLAAALLRASGWVGQAPLVDPMCGAGTIPIEAALLARRIAPGLAAAARAPRGYAFEEWPVFDRGLWDRVVERARAEVLPAAPVVIRGSDRDAGAVEAARANAARAGVGDDITFEIAALSALRPPPGPGWLVTNPPYGVRVGESADLRDLYAALGALARRELAGWTLAMLSADRRLEGQVGVRWTEALRTRNGGIPVRMVVGMAVGTE